jgi:hypothetical protein
MQLVSALALALAQALAPALAPALVWAPVLPPQSLQYPAPWDFAFDAAVHYQPQKALMVELELPFSFSFLTSSWVTAAHATAQVLAAGVVQQC